MISGNPLGEKELSRFVYCTDHNAVELWLLENTSGHASLANVSGLKSNERDEQGNAFVRGSLQKLRVTQLQPLSWHTMCLRMLKRVLYQMLFWRRARHDDPSILLIGRDVAPNGRRSDAGES